MTQQAQTQMSQPAQSATPRTGGLLQRQCSCGNHTIAGGECQACSNKRLQTKLQVNEPGDVYEQEADRIADQVMATPAHHAVNSAPLQIQRFSGQSNGQMNAAAPASIDRALASPSSPLAPELRQDMEQRFAVDFSKVRVHTGAVAEQSARDVNANAYTIAHHIVFGAGQYAPGTQTGRGLLAHELAHVVQQRGSTATLSRLRLGVPDSREEHEAHTAAANVSQGEPANITLSSAPGLVQRQLCGGQILPPCPTKYKSVPSNSAIGNIMGRWIGLKYRQEFASPKSSYLLVDHELFLRNQQGGVSRLSRNELSQRTSQTGTPRSSLDPDVYIALQTHELFQGLRPDILDSDLDHLYEIKPVRGRGAGPPQLNNYINLLRTLAPRVPAWMGGRARNWQPGAWRPSLQLPMMNGTHPALVCVYPDAVPGILLYDLLQCRRPKFRRRRYRLPSRSNAIDWSRVALYAGISLAALAIIAAAVYFLPVGVLAAIGAGFLALLRLLAGGLALTAGAAAASADSSDADTDSGSSSDSETDTDSGSSSDLEADTDSVSSSDSDAARVPSPRRVPAPDPTSPPIKRPSPHKNLPPCKSKKGELKAPTKGPQKIPVATIEGINPATFPLDAVVGVILDPNGPNEKFVVLKATKRTPRGKETTLDFVSTYECGCMEDGCSTGGNVYSLTEPYQASGAPPLHGYVVKVRLEAIAKAVKDALRGFL
jgi:hypothetical protein